MIIKIDHGKKRGEAGLVPVRNAVVHTQPRFRTWRNTGFGCSSPHTVNWITTAISDSFSKFAATTTRTAPAAIGSMLGVT